MTSLNGDASGASLLFKADTGGRISLSNVSQPVTGNVLALALDGGTIRVPDYGDGWHIQAIDGDIELGENGGEYVNSLIEVVHGGIYGGELASVGAGSRLEVSAYLPGGEHSRVFGVLANRGVMQLGPRSVLEVAESYHQSADGSLSVYLTNPGPITPSDPGAMIQVETGLTQLAGNLNVVGAGATLNYHDTINLIIANPLTGGTITGHFNTITGMAQENGLYLVPRYNDILFFGFLTHAVRLVAEIGGDTNRDGVADGADYTNWADHFLRTGQSWETGDFNGDGIVDGADYTVWADHFAPAQLSLATVPEPSALALASLGALALLARQLRSRRASH